MGVTKANEVMSECCKAREPCATRVNIFVIGLPWTGVDQQHFDAVEFIRQAVELILHFAFGGLELPELIGGDPLRAPAMKSTRCVARPSRCVSCSLPQPLA